MADHNAGGRFLAVERGAEDVQPELPPGTHPPSMSPPATAPLMEFLSSKSLLALYKYFHP